MIVYDVAAAAIPAASMAPVVVSAPVAIPVTTPVTTGPVAPVVVVPVVVVTPVAIGAVAIVKSTTPYVDIGAVDIGVVIIIDDDVVVIPTSNRPIANLRGEIPRSTGTPVGSVSGSVSSNGPIPNLTRKISSTSLTWSIQTSPTRPRKIHVTAPKSWPCWVLSRQRSRATKSWAVKSPSTNSGLIPILTGECCGTASAGVGSIHSNLPTPRSIADLSG
jgi:hypothetical protein